jgi:hypothetical protein
MNSKNLKMRVLLGGAIQGALLGTVAACVAKGAMIGLEQTGYGFGWLSVVIDALAGPVLLIPDLMMVLGPGGFGRTVVLPWAIVGFALGALCGIAAIRSPSSDGPDTDDDGHAGNGDALED